MQKEKMVNNHACSNEGGINSLAIVQKGYWVRYRNRYHVMWLLDNTGSGKYHILGTLCVPKFTKFYIFIIIYK